MQEGQTGRLFKTEDDLFNIIKDIGTNWEAFEPGWTAMRKNVLNFKQRTFRDEWRDKVLPLTDSKFVRLSELSKRLKGD